MYLDPQHWLDPIKNSEFCQNCFKVVRPNNRNGRVPTEEYRYLYILLRTESTNPSSKKNASPKLSLPALWAVIQTDRQVVQYTAEQAGRGWMRQLFLWRWGSGVRSQQEIYSLVPIEVVSWPECCDEELSVLAVSLDGPGHGHPVVLVQGGVHLVKQVEGGRVTFLDSSKYLYSVL